jgi:hypothetical protein
MNDAIAEQGQKRCAAPADFIAVERRICEAHVIEKLLRPVLRVQAGRVGFRDAQLARVAQERPVFLQNSILLVPAKYVKLRVIPVGRWKVVIAYKVEMQLLYVLTLAEIAVQIQWASGQF